MEDLRFTDAELTWLRQQGQFSAAFLQTLRDFRFTGDGYAEPEGTIVFESELMDTYDTLEGVRRVIELARQLGDEFKVQSIRLDSGDLAELAKASRQLLDDAGLHKVKIIVSSGLDEH